ncbi:MAG: hypothetical protein HKN14_02530 [Marinicaulis sp.]|nr:hypothetical protein [Marinicaulis sp.]NNE39776.1 hypothetical protein [Marinicaulis sp.]
MTFRYLMSATAALAASTAFAPAIAQEHGSPFKATDLVAGERWFTRDHGGGDQTLGHDLTIRRYTGSNQWTCNKPGTNGSKNSDKMTWKKPVYAIEDGVVERCWKNAPDNPKPGEEDSRVGAGTGKIPSGGNHILVRRPDGGLMLYAHFAKGEVSSALCPQTPELMQSGQAKGFVFPEADRPILKRGQFIGRAGNTGSSSGPHLHLHAITENGAARALPMERGLVSNFTPSGGNDCNGEANINSWSKLNGSPIPQDDVLYWPPTPVGKEYTRHKYSESAMPRMFQHLADSGYMLDWIDGYSVGGKVHYNHIWKPANKNWRALFGLTQAQFQQRLDQQSEAGYEPVHLDSYTRSGQVRYAIIFHKNAPGSWRLRTNRTQTQHQAILDQAKADGLKPRAISVVSVNGQRRYSALYRSQNIGSWQAKSAIKESDYQGVYNANKQAGRQPIYLNAYKHGSEIYVSAIFASAPKTLLRAKHGMNPSGFQSEFNKNTGDGYTTEVITAYDGAASNHRYFGVWRKPSGPTRAR